MNLYNKELLFIGVAIVALCIVQRLLPKKEGFEDKATTIGLSFFVALVLLLFSSWILYTSYKLSD